MCTTESGFFRFGMYLVSNRIKLLYSFLYSFCVFIPISQKQKFSLQVLTYAQRLIPMETDVKSYKWFNNWILNEDHPCIMAQTVFRMGHVDYNEYSGFGTPRSVNKMLCDLENYINAYDFSDNQFSTFIATFPDERLGLTEREFEERLWRQLQFLHHSDDYPWDPEVNPDPDDHDFSFSLKGRAFYIIGLHPNSSRIARRTPYPTLTFNLHFQFEKLREMKRFQHVKNRIRKRDTKLQGSVNPELEDFGKSSEAKQYSGRRVEENWKCPFHHK